MDNTDYLLETERILIDPLFFTEEIILLQLAQPFICHI